MIGQSKKIFVIQIINLLIIRFHCRRFFFFCILMLKNEKYTFPFFFFKQIESFLLFLKILEINISISMHNR